MIFPITASESPLEFDTLPALKCTFWQEGSRRVHTLARLYSLSGTLQLSLCAFEREPAPNSTMGFALSGNGRKLLFVGLNPESAWLQPMESLPPSLPEAPPENASIFLPVERFSGADEQGWYWGGRLSVPNSILTSTDCTPLPDSSFWGGLFKYGTGPLGSSCHPADAEPPQNSFSMDKFVVVNY